MAERHKFETEDDLREWLKKQPSAVAVAIAARIAMRAFMIAAPNLDPADRNQRAALILPIFRAIALTWVVSKYPTQGARMRVAAVTARRAVPTGTHDAANAAARAAVAVLHTINNRGSKAIGARQPGGKDIGARQSRHTAADSVAANSASELSEIIHDANLVLQSTPQNALQTLCDQKLWWQPHGKMSAGWRDFAEALSDRKRIKDPHTGATRAVPKDPEDRRNDEDWWVWTDWMHDRITGAPSIETLELERTQIPDEEWIKGPRHVNRLIAEMIKRHEGDSLRAKTPLTETIARDSETGLHTLLPDTVTDARRYENALNKVADTVARIRAARQTPWQRHVWRVGDHL